MSSIQSFAIRIPAALVSRWRSCMTLAAVLVCLAVAPGASSEDIDPNVQALLKRMAEFHASLDAFRVEITTEMRKDFGDKNESAALLMDAAFKKSRQGSIKLTDPQTGRLTNWVVSDGEHQYKYFADKSGYYEYSPADDLRQVLDEAIHMGMDLAICPCGMLDEIIADPPFSYWLRKIKKAEDLGAEKVNGVQCRHIRYRVAWVRVYANPVVDLWIADGDKPFILRALLDVTETEREFAAKTFTLAPDGRKVAATPPNRVVAELVFRNWTTDSQMNPDTFKFVPPEGAKLLPPPLY